MTTQTIEPISQPSPPPSAPTIDNRAGTANPESPRRSIFNTLQKSEFDAYQFEVFKMRGGYDRAALLAETILSRRTGPNGPEWIDDTLLAGFMRTGGFDLDVTMLRWLLSKMEDAGLVETKRRCGGRDAVSVRFSAAPAPKNDAPHNPLTLVSLRPSGKTIARRAGKRRVSVRTPSGSGLTPPTLTLRPACPRCIVIGDDLGAGCSWCAGSGAVTVTGDVKSILTALVQAELLREIEDNGGDDRTVSNFQRLIDIAAAPDSVRHRCHSDAKARADERQAKREAQRKEIVPMPQMSDADPFSDWEKAVDESIACFDAAPAFDERGMFAGKGDAS